jgi:hypothetical protein
MANAMSPAPVAKEAAPASANTGGEDFDFLLEDND